MSLKREIFKRKRCNAPRVDNAERMEEYRISEGSFGDLWINQLIETANQQPRALLVGRIVALEVELERIQEELKSIENHHVSFNGRF